MGDDSLIGRYEGVPNHVLTTRRECWTTNSGDCQHRTVEYHAKQGEVFQSTIRVETPATPVEAVETDADEAIVWNPDGITNKTHGVYIQKCSFQKEPDAAPDGPMWQQEMPSSMHLPRRQPGQSSYICETVKNRSYEYYMSTAHHPHNSTHQCRQEDSDAG